MLKITPQLFKDMFYDEPDKVAEFSIRLLKADCELIHFLNHRRGREAFHEFLKTEFATENFVFWDAVELFKGIEDGEARKRKAHEIRDLYILESAEHQVNIPFTMQKKILEDMENVGESREEDEGLFQEAQTEVYNLLVGDKFARFKKSSEFHAFLQALTLFQDQWQKDEEGGTKRKQSLRLTIAKEFPQLNKPRARSMKQIQIIAEGSGNSGRETVITPLSATAPNTANSSARDVTLPAQGQETGTEGAATVEVFAAKTEITPLSATAPNTARSARDVTLPAQGQETGTEGGSTVEVFAAKMGEAGPTSPPPQPLAVA